MPAIITVYADHLWIAFLDSEERFQTDRYRSWSDLLRDHSLRQFETIYVRRANSLRALAAR